MPRPKSMIPVGSQFTPGLVDLRAAVAACLEHSGDKDALRTAFWSPPVRFKVPTKAPTGRRMNLPLEAAVQYGLLEPRTWRATVLCRRLALLGGDDLRMEFARDILLNRGGLRVTEACEQMAADGLSITGDSLAGYLTDHGFRVSEHNTQINALRQWLAEAGVFPKGRKDPWHVSTERRDEILSLSNAAVGILAALTPEQQAFALALARMNPEGEVAAADVRALAEAQSGLKLDRSSLPKRFLDPLKEAGLIDYESGGTRGGKSARLRTTEQFRAEVIEPFMTTTVSSLDPEAAHYFRNRPEDIRADLDSAEPYTKGFALEAFAIYVMRLLGLRFVGWRRRAKGTGEVDVLLSGMHAFVAGVWQVQCKNTPGGTVGIRDLASEVGIALATGATHILVITRGGYSPDALAHARTINRDTPLSVYLLDGHDFNRILTHGSALGGILTIKGTVIERLKRERFTSP